MIVLAAAALLSTAKNADAQIALGGSAFVAHETGNVVGDPANNNFFGLTLGATWQSAEVSTTVSHMIPIRREWSTL